MSEPETLCKDMKKMDVNGKPQRKIKGNNSVALGIVTPHNVLQLKQLNEAVFPISYNVNFYLDIRYAGDLARLAYFNDVVVGAVCCRHDTIIGRKTMYIMTLGTLAPYRQIGIGKMLIDYVFDLCENDETIQQAALHVQVNNNTALNFYHKEGFETMEKVDDYYRITPNAAYLLVKRIRD